MHPKLDINSFGDAGYRWNEDIVPDMTDEERNEHFLASAQEEMEHNEPEVAYWILRELVWRSPYWKPRAWQLLSECAAIMGKQEEASKASNNYAVLRKRERLPRD